MDLAFYTAKGAFIYRQQVEFDKTSQNRWQLLHIQSRIPQDGYAVFRLQNKGQAPVWFDDLRVQASVGTVNVLSENEETSDIYYSTAGMAGQVAISEASVYDARSARRDCGHGSGSTGGAIEDNTVRFYDLGTDLDAVTVKASRPIPPAPVYVYVDGNAIPIYNVGGGSGRDLPTTTINNPGRNATQTFAKKFSTSCAGMQQIWAWSFQNNIPAYTREMGGYILADGSFIMMPWGNNGPSSVQYYNGSGTTVLSDNGHLYSVIQKKGVDYLRDEDLVYSNTNRDPVNNPNYTDTEITAYVHTHPWDRDNIYGYQTYAVTKGPDANNPNVAPNGDWALSKQDNIPGIIITPTTYIFFHYDSTKQNPQVVDGQVEKDDMCGPQQR